MSSCITRRICGDPHEPAASRRPHQVRRTRTVRRARPRAHPAGRLGLSDRRAGPYSGSSAANGQARQRPMPRPGARAAANSGGAMSYTVLGIAEDRALGGSLRVVVTKPEALRAATAAVEEIVNAIDLAAS